LSTRKIVQKVFRGFLQILNGRQKRRTKKIVLFSTVIAVADIIGLGSMVPVLMLAIDHSFLEKSSKLRTIYNYFEFNTEASFLKALIVLILLFFVLKSLMAILLQSYVRRTAADISTCLSENSYNHAFRKRSYVKIAGEGLGFNDMVIFTPYYFVSGVYLPFINLISEFVVVVMLTLFFTIYKPPLFFLIVGLLGTGFYIVNRTTRRRMTELGEKMAFQREQVIREVNYGISGFTDILSRGSIEWFREKMMVPYKAFVHSGIKGVSLQTIPSRVNEVVSLIGIIILVVYAYFYSSDNIGEVRVLAALFAIAIFRLIPAANRILQSMMHIKMNSYTIDKLSDIKQENESGENWIFSFNNSIELRDIHYSYPGKRKLFNGLDLTIQKGSCTGIQGASGSGKTTLIKTILGMVNPEKGGIYIDGQTVNDRDNMSGLVSYVGQDPYLFHGTVMENVVFDGKAVQADKAKVLKALEMAAFKMDGYGDDVLYLNVGELGSKLSEGQKQRLAIARAVYHASPVLIMDEPSSALDAETETELIKQLDVLKKLGKTILLIAHREKVFDICDTVYKLEYGKITRIK